MRWYDESIPVEGEPVQVWQLTSAPVISHDIYCEEVYASSDGGRITFVRSYYPSDRPSEVWVCDLSSMRVARIGEVASEFLATNPLIDAVYYVRPDERGHRLIRLDLKTLEQEEVFAFVDCPPPRVGTVPPDERYFVGGPLRVRGNVYALYKVDLERGTWEVFHEHEDIFNPHVQFDPGGSGDLLVQLNRGGILDEEGNVVRLIGEEGATLYVVDLDGKDVKPLPVGRPYTEKVTGHECWIGESGRVLLTTADGGVYSVAPGDEEAELLVKMEGFCHISASAGGKYFVVDDMRTGRLYVGSTSTGKVLPLCESRASCGRPQYTHPHPYITPDNRYVVFNSDRTGICQVYAAALPVGTVEDLLESLGREQGCSPQG